MKWPGLFQITARVVTFPVALFVGGLALIWVLFSDGCEWWTDRFKR